MTLFVLLLSIFESFTQSFYKSHRFAQRNKDKQLSALLTTLKTRPKLLTTYKFTICCCPAWRLLCLFRTPHTHRSAYSLCASSHRWVLEYSLVQLLVEYSSNRLLG